MIIVKVELHSAITGQVTEIGRMRISNDGRGTALCGNYDVALMRRGALHKVQRTARVEAYPRQSYTVWELVRRALQNVLGKKPEPMPTEELASEALEMARDVILESEDT